MLEVQSLQIKYGEVEAVKGLSLTLAKGEILALVGANGAGKSSTLAGIAGLVTPKSGKVTFEGQDITGLSPEKISHRGIALVPEGRRIFANLTVQENLRLGGAMHLRGQHFTEAEAEVLELFPILRTYYRKKGGLLSGGEQQMLAIGRAMMAAPKLILLDEPSLGLAPQLIDTVFELIAKLRDNGKTILLIEQNIGLALEIADRAVVLTNGAVTMTGSAADLRQSDQIRQAYLGISA